MYDSNLLLFIDSFNDESDILLKFLVFQIMSIWWLKIMVFEFLFYVGLWFFFFLVVVLWTLIYFEICDQEIHVSVSSSL